MQTDKELGDELLELAETIHFIPLNGFTEWALPDVMQMDVGTIINGHLRIRTQTDTEYLEGTIHIMPEGLQFNHA
jgi:hypothetical protein